MDDMSPLMNIHDMHFVHTDWVLALKNQLTVSNGSHKGPTNMYGPCWRLDELGSISIKEFSNESGPMMVEICILLFYSPFFVLSPSPESERVYGLEIFSLASHLLFISKWLYPE